MLMRHGLEIVSSENDGLDATATPDSASELGRDERAGQAAPRANPPMVEGLSQELEALLDLVRQAPQALPAPPYPQAATSADAATHDMILQALRAKAATDGAAEEAARYREDPTVTGRQGDHRRVAPAGTALATSEARLPATWYNPSVAAPEPWFGSELRAGALGLGLGILVIVPVVLLSSGWLLTDRSTTGGTAGKSVKAAATTAPLIASLAEPKVELAAVRREPILAASPEPVAAEAGHPLVAHARLMIESGDIASARAILSDAGLAGRAEAQFVLAETFDPNVLAAWGTRGIAADVEKARAHYQVALGLGQTTARERLKGLQ